MEKVILDTSVVAKWYSQEEDTSQAVKILEAHKQNRIIIFLPEIVGLELANALFWSAGYKGEKLKEALDLFYALNLSLMRLSKEIVHGASVMMEKFAISIYDAVFIYLSEEEKIPLITADKKHHKKEFSKYIRYLG